MTFIEMCLQGIEKMLAQGKPCADDKGACQYEANGLRCVVGHMMPANHEDADLVGSGILGNHVVQSTLAEVLGRPLSAEELGALSLVQGWHDCTHRNAESVRLADLIGRLEQRTKSGGKELLAALRVKYASAN